MAAVENGTGCLSNEKLHGILEKIGAPLIELAFFEDDKVERLQEQLMDRLPQKIINSISEVTEAGKRRNGNIFNFGSSGNSTENVQLAWNDSSKKERVDLLSYFATMSRATGGYSARERSKLKNMPIFPTLAGNCVSISSQQGNSNQDQFYTFGEGVRRGQFPLSESASKKLLENLDSSGCQELYEHLDIQALEEPDLVRQFVVPDFESLNSEGKLKTLKLIKSKWEELGNNEGMVDAMKELKFIPAEDRKTLLRAKDFFDPDNELLAFIFDDEPNRFPTGVFLKEDWLSFLRKIGLVTRVTPAVYYECIRKVEQDGKALMYKNNGFVDIKTVSKAERLLCYFKDETHFSDLYSVETTERLSKACFVPVLKPLNLDASEEGTNIGLANSSDNRSNQKFALVKFSDCVSYKDRHLAWSQLPVLSKRLEPQYMVCQKVGLQSPPEPSVVKSHLRLICDDATTVSNNFLLSYPDPPEEVFATILKYLEKRLRGLSSDEKEKELKSLRKYFCLPIGSILIKPSRLYFRLTENLAPFMFEVPRIFGPFEELLLELGAAEKPEIRDYCKFLSELKHDTGENALNPNELLAVLRVIELIAANIDTTTTGDGLQLQVPFVPDENSRLVRPNHCIFRDNIRLAQRINSRILRFASYLLTKKTCEKLAIPFLSHIVKEELVTNHQSFNGNTVIDENATALLKDMITHKAIAMILLQSNNDSSSLRSNLGPNEHAEWIGQILLAHKVVMIPTFRTRFVLQGTVGLCKKGSDVTRVGYEEDGAFFVDSNSKNIYVSSNKLSKALRLEQVVAMAVGQMLDISNIALLDSLFTISGLSREKNGNILEQEIETILRANRITRDVRGIQEKLRGEPGNILSDSDTKIITLSPLRAFLPGEIIAVADEDEETHSKGKVTLRYAVVVGSSNESDNTLKRIEVIIKPGVRKSFVSSEVYAFVRSSSNPSSERLLRKRSSEDVSMLVPKNKSFDTTSHVGIIGQSEESSDKAVNPLDSSKYIKAVEDILSKVNLSIDSNYAELMAETLSLRQDIEHVQKSKNKLLEQIHKMESDAKRVNEAFLCSICMENQVNRSIIPSGKLICQRCSQNLRGICPFTRQPITGFVPFFSPLST